LKTFFLQLFLSFWLAAIGIFVGSAWLFPESNPGSFENFRIAGITVSTRIVDDSLAAFDRGGCDALRRHDGAFVLLRTDTTPLCGEPVNGEEKSLAQRATHSKGWSINGHIGEKWVQIRPVASTDGRHWLLLERTPYVQGSWLPPLPRDWLPISIAVTFICALVLTYPVRRLSKAFRTFAAGDLSVRLTVSKHWWNSIGGSDVRDLMLDFNHMAGRIGELIEAQKLLVRDISHELRSPLARLRLALEMTREESVEELPSLDRMEAEAERVNELIGQMLTLSRMESTKQLTQTEPVSAADIVESLLPNMEFEAAGRGCGVRYNSTGVVPATAGNRELLRRAFENVIRNAIRFTAVGSQVEIEVAAEQCATLFGPAVRVTISDRGPGVPEQSLGLIFRAFYRTDSARRDATGGFGVGLSIAERAVALHGGRISAHNRTDGPGLRIEILLPQAETREGAQRLLASAAR
jgi:two-component system sensor histidine kinase CpxA